MYNINNMLMRDAKGNLIEIKDNFNNDTEYYKSILKIKNFSTISKVNIMNNIINSVKK